LNHDDFRQAAFIRTCNKQKWPPVLVVHLPKTSLCLGAVGVDPYTADQRNAAFVQFPGGYIAEIHSPVSN
jgi:hypothetical protein